MRPNPGRLRRLRAGPRPASARSVSFEHALDSPSTMELELGGPGDAFFELATVRGEGVEEIRQGDHALTLEPGGGGELGVHLFANVRDSKEALVELRTRGESTRLNLHGAGAEDAPD